MKGNRHNYWQFRESASISDTSRFITGVLVSCGVLSVASLFDWWFREVHIGNITLYLILSVILWWGLFRLTIQWISYLKIKKPEIKPAPKDLKVAIFTTSSPGEPLSMFEKTLEACNNITYPHTTYLLDDTRDPEFTRVAEKHNAVWLELVDIPGAKAGKINEALKRVKEDFILILDPDHIPFPCFLDKVLGFFEDSKVGYVQVSQAYYNQHLSFTARGAAEQTYNFYGPTQMSLYGFNSSVAIGANCTFRRAALESAGGHGVGLAEDLVTAIRIHAKGWKSIYSPVIVSRGLVPEELGSFSKQQLKWARGVHEVLFDELPANRKGLSFWQRLSYFTIGTYYLNGLTLFLFIIIPYLFIWFGVLPAKMNFIDFIIRWLPVGISGLAIYLYVQRWLCHPEQERGIHWRGMVLKFASWPVYLLGFLLSLFNREIPYIPTAKKAVRGFSPYIYAIIFQQLLFLLTLVVVVIKRKYFTQEASMALSSGFVWGMVAFASIPVVISTGAIYAAFESLRIKTKEPWADVDLNKISCDEKTD
ncbi:MAG: integral membrane glycosyltransferase [Bacteroidetes bacterium HGW-Bacteroidetes-8]|jgi:cellulose synthase (UDP-forming)|nr:MAG: integral membrane glycosyltransferase [Bacteroidetes bacterium HGW-Bacteroidetes-8]